MSRHSPAPWIRQGPGPAFRVVNDDDPGDYAYPQEVALSTIRENGDTETLAAVLPLAIGESATVGGGAGVQFTLTRVR